MIKECTATKFITTSPGTKLWKFTFTGTTANLPAVYLMDNGENLPVSCFSLPYSSLIKAATSDQGSHCRSRQLPCHCISFLTGLKMKPAGQILIFIHSWAATNYVTQTIVFKKKISLKRQISTLQRSRIKWIHKQECFSFLNQDTTLAHASHHLYSVLTTNIWVNKMAPCKRQTTQALQQPFNRRQTQIHKNKETALLFMNSFTHTHAPMDTRTRMHEFIYTISLVLFPHTLKVSYKCYKSFNLFSQQINIQLIKVWHDISLQLQHSQVGVTNTNTN